ncbi:MAG: S-ribosylhomocysteine lyase [Legionellales bacterium]|nr:S-ribosylhomocysteine lyase [Legionellales bacterium]
MKLSYSTHGLPGTIFEILDALDAAGYEGVELAFQEGQFDLRAVPLHEIANCPIIMQLKSYFKTKRIKPAAINTATLPLIPGRLHEPSLLAIDKPERDRRIHIIKQGIEAAKALGAPIVGFGSGFIRSEHVAHTEGDCRSLLLSAIQECLNSIQDHDDVTLVIEPEPGMLIETLDQGASIIQEINSKKFGLHLDVCHAFCSDGDDQYLQKISDYAHLVQYVHLADTKDGYNLKIMENSAEEPIDFQFANAFIYFQENGNFLLLDVMQSLYFYLTPPNDVQKQALEHYISIRGGVTDDVQYHNLQSLPNRADFPKYYPDYLEKDKEIRTYLLSIPRISDETLTLAEPILHYLRSSLSTKSDHPFIQKRVANTLTGKVHFHEAPGQGEIDFSEVFLRLAEQGFEGYASLELYHDGEPDRWQSVMKNSKASLEKAQLKQLGWTLEEQGDIDHTRIQAPSIRLNSCKIGRNGDKIYSIDLRILPPNQTYLDPKLMHSFEHYLLAGFRKYLGESFVCVAPMGCQTGFYLILLNEGRVSTICTFFESILQDILVAEEVPYANIHQCGQAALHDIDPAKSLAQLILSKKLTWRKFLQ